MDITIIIRRAQITATVGSDVQLECYAQDNQNVVLVWSRQGGLPLGRGVVCVCVLCVSECVCVCVCVQGERQSRVGRRLIEELRNAKDAEGECPFSLMCQSMV